MKNKTFLLLILVIFCLFCAGTVNAATIAVLDDLTVDVSVTGAPIPTGYEDIFNFIISSEDPGTPLPTEPRVTLSVTDIKNGNNKVIFGEITYEIPNIYIYDIKMIPGSDPNYIYDSSVHKVFITVKADGTLISQINGSEPEFSLSMEITPSFSADHPAYAKVLRNPTDEDITSMVNWTMTPADLFTVNPDGTIKVNMAKVYQMPTDNTTVTVLAEDPRTGKTAVQDVVVNRVNLNMDFSGIAAMGEIPGKFTLTSPDGTEDLTSRVLFESTPNDILRVESDGTITILKNPPVDTLVTVVATDPVTGITGTFTVNVEAKPLIITDFPTGSVSLGSDPSNIIKVKEPNGSLPGSVRWEYTLSDGSDASYWVEVRPDGTLHVKQNPPADTVITIVPVDENGAKGPAQMITIEGKPLTITNFPAAAVVSLGSDPANIIQITEPDGSPAAGLNWEYTLSDGSDASYWVEIQSDGKLHVKQNPPADTVITIVPVDVNGAKGPAQTITIESKPLTVTDFPAGPVWLGNDPANIIRINEPDGSSAVGVSWEYQLSDGSDASFWVEIQPDGKLHVLKNPANDTEITFIPTDINGVKSAAQTLTVETRPLNVTDFPAGPVWLGNDPANTIIVTEPDGSLPGSVTWTYQRADGSDASDLLVIQTDGTMRVLKNPAADTTVTIIPTDENGAKGDPLTITVETKPLNVTDFPAGPVWLGNDPANIITVTEPDGSLPGSVTWTYQRPDGSDASDLLEIRTDGTMHVLKNPGADTVISIFPTDENGAKGGTLTITLETKPLIVNNFPTSSAWLGNDPANIITVTEPDGSTPVSVTWSDSPSGLVEILPAGTLHVRMNPGADTEVTLIPMNDYGAKGPEQKITIETKPLKISGIPTSAVSLGSDPTEKIIVKEPDDSDPQSVVWTYDGQPASDWIEILPDGTLHVKKNPGTDTVVKVIPTDENGAKGPEQAITIETKPLNITGVPSAPILLGNDPAEKIIVKEPDGSLPGSVTWSYDGNAASDWVEILPDGTVHVKQNPAADTPVTIAAMDENGAVSDPLTPVVITIKSGPMTVETDKSEFGANRPGKISAVKGPDNNAAPTPYSYTVSDPALVSVDTDGNITILGNPSSDNTKVTITVEDKNSVTALKEITVRKESLNANASSSAVTINTPGSVSLTCQPWGIDVTASPNITVFDPDALLTFDPDGTVRITGILTADKLVTLTFTDTVSGASCTASYNLLGPVALTVSADKERMYATSGQEISFSVAPLDKLAAGGIWTSNRNDLVTLDGNGKMTFTASSPIAAAQTVTAIYDGTDIYGNTVSATKAITLDPVLTGITINGGANEMYEKTSSGSLNTMTLSVGTVSPSGVVLDNTKTNWTVTGDATINSATGVLTAKDVAANKTATVTLSVTDMAGITKTATKTVTIKPTLESVSITAAGNKTEISSALTLQFTAATTPGTDVVPLRSGSWSIKEGTTYATINSDGLLTPNKSTVKADQNVTIVYTATDNAGVIKKGEKPITIKYIPATSVKVNNLTVRDWSIKDFDKIPPLTFEVSPEGAVYDSMEWKNYFKNNISIDKNTGKLILAPDYSNNSEIVSPNITITVGSQTYSGSGTEIYIYNDPNVPMSFTKTGGMGPNTGDICVTGVSCQLGTADRGILTATITPHPDYINKIKWSIADDGGKGCLTKFEEKTDNSVYIELNANCLAGSCERPTTPGSSRICTNRAYILATIDPFDLATSPYRKNTSIELLSKYTVDY